MKIFRWLQKKTPVADKLSPSNVQRVGPVKLGASVHRKEDYHLVTGQGRYVSDIDIGPFLYVTFARSSVAAGQITAIDLDNARPLEGIAAIVTGTDVADLGNLAVNPILKTMNIPDYPILAQGYVHAVGQPIAAVLSKTAVAGLDAVDLISADIEPSSEAIVSLNQLDETASADIEQCWAADDVDEIFEKAAHIVTAEIEHPRLAPSPMENRAIAVQYHADTDSVTVYLSSQTPHRARTELAKILKTDRSKIRVISPDVGGAFGLKASLYPEEVFTCWAALNFKQSVKWISTRNEDLLTASHGRGLKTRGELAIDKDGRFLGLKASVRAPLGHWLPNSAAIPAWNAVRMLPGPYDINSISLETRGFCLNTGPVGIYRGAGRPEAITLLERLVDKAANRLGVDPIEIRLKNLLTPDQLPRKNIAGAELDSGDYPELLNKLLDVANYPALKSQIEQFNDPEKLKGLGVSFYVEPCGRGWESASVTLHPNGKITASTGGSTQGHGRETAFAQILSDLFGIDFDDITILHGNTETCPEGIGALASRSTAIGGSALLIAGQEVLERAKGNLTPEADITARIRYENGGEAWGYGAYLAEITIDAGTGQLTIDKITCLDDAGTLINPMLVEGQIMGGIAQGIGEALMEEVHYSDDGQLLTGSFMDYAMPRASDMPDLSITKMQTPSPNNLLGAKGVGEAGTIAAPIAILNAAHHALRHFETNDLQMPLVSEKIWRVMQQPKKETTS